MSTLSNIHGNSSSLVSFGFKEIGPYYWVGNCTNGVHYYAGQTFLAPEKGILKRIKIFSSIVYGSTTATLSLYNFDQATYTWKEKKAETKKFITKGFENQWIHFDLPHTEVNKNENYAFKLSCHGEGMLAIAECPWHIQNPYAEGEEWIGSSYKQQGNFHKDFDLAFEGEIEVLPNSYFV